jgi:hypothetical protein
MIVFTRLHHHLFHIVSSHKPLWQTHLTIRLLFDGARIQDDQTAADLELEDGDSLEVLLERECSVVFFLYSCGRGWGCGCDYSCGCGCGWDRWGGECVVWCGCRYALDSVVGRNEKRRQAWKLADEQRSVVVDVDRLSSASDI